MATVRKAIITAAGSGTRMYPASQTVQKELFPLVDTDGYAKPVLQIIAEEVAASGIEEICIVANPANADAIKRHFQGFRGTGAHPAFAGKPWAQALADTLAEIGSRITIVVQETQQGFGHAVLQAQAWVGDDPFALLLGDHVYLSQTGTLCTRQVLETFAAHGCAVSSVARAPESQVFRYGIVGGERVPGAVPPVYTIRAMIEKPAIEQARAHLQTAGLPTGEYLCFFGIHVFPSSVFGDLEHVAAHETRQNGEITLTSALERLHARERYVVAEVAGTRCDMGVPEGLVETQIALALHGPFREAALRLLHALGN